MKKQQTTGGATLPLQMCISIHVSSQCLPWCGVNIVIGVGLSQDLPGGGWTSAASEVLSHEITDLIKSSPSPSPFSTSLLSMWLSPRLPLSSTPSLSVGSLFLYTLLSCTSHTFFLLALFSLTFLVSFSHPHHTSPLLSSPPPASRSQGEDPASCSWVLLKLQLCQPACSRDVPKPQGSSDLRMKCKIYSHVNAESGREEAMRGRTRR